MQANAEAVIRQWFEELWNQAREDTIDRLLAPGGLVHGLPTPDGKPLVGGDAFKELYRQFRSAFPDMKIAIERVVSEGSTAAVLVRASGTHLGDGLGTPPTRKPVSFHGMVIVTAANGRLTEGWNTFDFLTMYQQIGLVPSFGGVAAP
jgi:predicted ester cyclase